MVGRPPHRRAVREHSGRKFFRGPISLIDVALTHGYEGSRMKSWLRLWSAGSCRICAAHTAQSVRPGLWVRCNAATFGRKPAHSLLN